MAVKTRSLPEVWSDNKAVAKALEGAFRHVAENDGTRIFKEGPECLPLAAGILKYIFWKAREQIGNIKFSMADLVVAYKGDNASFTYSGELYHGRIPKGPGILGMPYCETNEKSGPASDSVLSGMEGIGRYLGIAGGLASFRHIHLLQRKNILQGIELTDNNQDQNFFNMLRIFDYDITYASPRMSRPALPEGHVHPKNIEMTMGRIEDKIKAPLPPAVYFVYLSNAFALPIFTDLDNGLERPWGGRLPRFELDGWADFVATGRLVRDLVSNPAFLDGSTVMFAKAEGYSSFMFQKREGRAVPMTLICPGVTSRNGNVKIEIDAELQQQFLDSMVANDALFRVARRSRLTALG